MLFVFVGFTWCTRTKGIRWTKGLSALSVLRIFKWCCTLPLYRAQWSVQNGHHCFVFFFPGRLWQTGLPRNNGFHGQSSKCANTPKNRQMRACGTPFLNNTGSLADSHCPTTGRARSVRRSGTSWANRIIRKSLFLSTNVFQLLLLVHCFTWFRKSGIKA